MDYVPSNPSGKCIEECKENNISKNQHDPTVDSRYMATEALLVHPNPAPLNMDELLFNVNQTLPESEFPISTVQNVGNI